jgi:MerR family copper efflux transcriptional regulator
MLIGALAKMTGLSKDGLRHYESLGLIHSRPVQAGSRSYRQYDDSTVERLALIALGKRLRFPLREMSVFLDRLLADQISREERSAVLLNKVAQIDTQIADLQAARSELLALATTPDKDVVDGRLQEMGLALKKRRHHPD